MIGFENMIFYDEKFSIGRHVTLDIAQFDFERFIEKDLYLRLMA